MKGESEQLSQLEQVFRQPDAVMEPNIFDTLCQYVAAHGKPRTAIELLCENYVGASMRWMCIALLWPAHHVNVLILTCRRCICTGFAQMGSLVCDWLTLTDAHSQRSEHQQATPPPDLSAAHFLRVQFCA
jgi:TH1 protein